MNWPQFCVVSPPAIRTPPSGNGAAAAPARGMVIGLIAATLFVLGSKISAPFKKVSLLPPGPLLVLTPPANRTRPSASGAPTVPSRKPDTEPIGLHTLVLGS